MVIPNRVYRHFKGGYYLVKDVAVDESNPNKSLVVYQSLNNGSGTVWVRELSNFESLVPEDKFNPTGQKYRFTMVTDFRNYMRDVPTETLFKELTTRKDSPVLEMDVEVHSSKVLCREFLVINNVDLPFDAEFNILGAFDTYEDANEFLEDNPHRISENTRIVKRVFIDYGDAYGSFDRPCTV